MDFMPFLNPNPLIQEVQNCPNLLTLKYLQQMEQSQVALQQMTTGVKLRTRGFAPLG